MQPVGRCGQPPDRPARGRLGHRLRTSRTPSTHFLDTVYAEADGYRQSEATMSRISPPAA
ncbi:hypothetical protein L083_4379 [Actinoplanes sp. N902-109]|nr:hypothetical protein L083_4379 [Actinoplanes sp. N902-109]